MDTTRVGFLCMVTSLPLPSVKCKGNSAAQTCKGNNTIDTIPINHFITVTYSFSCSGTQSSDPSASLWAVPIRWPVPWACFLPFFCRCSRQKKSPDQCTLIRGLPIFLECASLHSLSTRVQPLPSLAVSGSQTGLLTPGSFYWLRLPKLLSSVTYIQRSSPVTAAGPSRILTGFPIKLYIKASENV